MAAKDLMDVGFVEEVRISHNTFRISVNELLGFLRGFRVAVAEKIETLVELNTQIQCLRCVNDIGVGGGKSNDNLWAAEEVVPDLQQRLKKFSFGIGGVSLQKSIECCLRQSQGATAIRSRQGK